MSIHAYPVNCIPFENLYSYSLIFAIDIHIIDANSCTLCYQKDERKKKKKKRKTARTEKVIKIKSSMAETLSKNTT